VTEYQVANLGDADLLYSVGAHPFLSCPIDEEGLSLGDHWLEFDAVEGQGAIARSFGAPDLLAAAFSDDGRRLSLSDELFVDGAFCLTSPPLQRVRLRCGDSALSVEMDLGSAQYLQVWTRPGTNVTAAGASQSHRFETTLHR
jgi:galactose mutarotase-like enzyme